MLARKYLLNPFYIYSITLFAVMLLYNNNWVDFYLPLNPITVIILIVYILLNFGAGLFWHFLKFDYVDVNLFKVKSNRIYGRKLYIIGCVLIIAECVLQTPPILGYVKYTEFGYPIIHVVSLCFINVGLLLLIVSNCLDRTTYKYILFAFLLSILIVNRFQILTVLLLAVIYFFNSRNINFKYIIIGFIGAAGIVWGFGELGIYRMKEILDIDYQQAKNYILIAGHASDLYKSYNFPISFFWLFLYITSPLANFNYNVIINSNFHCFSNVGELIVNEILPQTISKHFLNYSHIEPSLLVDNFNVSMGIVGVYNYLGFLGILIYFLYTFLLLSISRYLVRKNKYIKMALTINFTLYIPFLIFFNIQVMPVYLYSVILLVLYGMRYND
ncbi:hypothetical protein ACFO1C_003748 [Photobacterium damselae]